MKINKENLLVLRSVAVKSQHLAPEHYAALIDGIDDTLEQLAINAEADERDDNYTGDIEDFEGLV